MDNCLNCGQKLNKNQFKFCSNRCQSKRRQFEYIQQWQRGLVNGSRGLVTKNISKYLKHFLEEKFGNKCSLCGWNERNSTTGKVPLEVDHVNGNSEDNCEENLRLVCPNCHSLSPNFRNLNRGHGRIWRTNKYLKNTTILTNSNLIKLKAAHFSNKYEYIFYPKTIKFILKT